MSDHTLIMQQKEGNHARYAMRVLQLKQPRLVHLKNIPESLHNDCGLRFQRAFKDQKCLLRVERVRVVCGSAQKKDFVHGDVGPGD